MRIKFIGVKMVGNIPTDGGLRQSSWIPARDIPLSVLNEMGYDNLREDHPHHIEGLAWDLERQEWRNLKNAQAGHLYRVEIGWDIQRGKSLFSVLQ